MTESGAKKGKDAASINDKQTVDTNAGQAHVFLTKPDTWACLIKKRDMP